ncbi:enoyl-CoA hydratase/isomerase family protein (plasmid) [Rhodococcus sp. USK10]|uniref:enoyl-CoA hydratase-related protein n=1 Tax=Rhodococcus sp. USK10 TaxID=2789739 RepID=UPI001C5D9979|nr:enoyl-CoA hydratase-related protein [Rhodococcus sp. USK10]QYB00280.1 enoyl-CoA hydratase/isomerase family protein [Rhodococcus sp. USK10]
MAAPVVAAWDEISYTAEGQVAVITLDAPERRNALRNQLLRDLWEALDIADRDPEVRAVVLTGAGESFCVGAELTGPDTLIRCLEEDVQGHTPTGYREPGGRVSERLFDMRTPVIAAVNGDAVGGGASIMAATDVRIASDKARFGFVFTRRGVVPESGSSWFLPRLVGWGRAVDWVLSGRLIDAQEAYSAGLVTRLVAPEDVLSEAMAYAEMIASQTSPTSCAHAKRLLAQSWQHSHPRTACEEESRTYAGLVDSADAREGIASFLERRPARFGPLDERPENRF